MEEGKTIHNAQCTMHNCKDGYKKTELGWMPEDWQLTRLDKICEFLDEMRKPIKATDREKMKGNVPYYGASGVIDWVNDYLFDEDLILLGEDGENIKSRNSPLAFKVEGKSWVNNHAHVLKIRNTSKDDIDYIVNSLEFKDYSSYVIGSAQPKLNKSECIKFIIKRPPLKEQRKIAEILSTVDSEIDDTDKLIEKTKELKKGLMQRLLTKGIGHTEFKKTEIGEIPVEWEVKTLGRVFKLSSGEFLSQKNIIEGLYPVYGGNGITGYHNEFKHEDPKIVIGRVGAKCGCVCKSMKKSWITDNALYISDKMYKFYDEFMFYLLSYLNLNKFANQNAQPVISGQKIYAINVGLPSFEEQKQIANILSTVDNEIKQYENKKAKLEELKKGLMQQLLTGKVRVF